MTSEDKHYSKSFIFLYICCFLKEFSIAQQNWTAEAPLYLPSSSYVVIKGFFCMIEKNLAYAVVQKLIFFQLCPLKTEWSHA